MSRTPPKAASGKRCVGWMGSKHGAVSNIGWCVRIWNHMRCTVQFTCRFMYDLVHMQVYRVDKAVAHALSDGDVDILIHERLFVRCAGGVVLVLSSSGHVRSVSLDYTWVLECDFLQHK